MEQMLSALDYLDNEKIIHRDIKPENILYDPLPEDRYHFQLADFGLANHSTLATTNCGTGSFQAPEFYPSISKVEARQIPKVDVWSLFATIIAVRSRYWEFPPNTNDYGVVLTALRAEARASPKLEPMARLHPDHRASAAQMLVLLFDGKSLTTSIPKVPPLGPDAHHFAEPSRSPRLRLADARTVPPQPATARPLIVHPPLTPRRSPSRNQLRLLAQPPPYSPNRRGNLAQPPVAQVQQIRVHRDGVVKHRPGDRPPRANAVARVLLEEKASASTEPPPIEGHLDIKRPHENNYRVPGAFVD